MDEELRQAIEAVKEQQPVELSLEWYQGTVKLGDIKQYIRANINSASRSFVAIGYYLKYVRDNQLYKEDGYTGVSEFAKAEFGISPAQASKFISINDRFSVDGNSPVLLDRYREFSSSKLSEMLYLTDEQLEQVTVGTTKAEIRQIGKPTKEEIETVSFSPAKTEPDPKKPYYECAAYRQYQYTTGCKNCFYDKADCPYDRTGYFEKIKQQEEWRIHCEVLKEMCDCLCKMYSYVLEKNNYSMETIKSLSRKDQEYSFGFGDSNGYSKYMARCKSERYYVETFDETAKWIFEAGEVDQHIWNFNGREWHNNHPAMTIDELDLSVSAYNALRRHDIGTVDGLCKHTERELLEDWKVGSFYTKQIIVKLSEIGRSLKPDIPEAVNDEPKNVDNEPEIVNDVDEITESKSNTEHITVFNNCIHNQEYQCDLTEELKLVTGPGAECFSEDEEEQTTCCWNCTRHGNCESECNSSLYRKPVSVETVEADIIETLSTETKSPDTPIPSHLELAKEMLKQKQERLKEFINIQTDVYADRKYIESRKVEVGALAAYICDLEEMPDPIKPVQPELPILKNNDRRAAFIDAYTTWPVWIETKETGERYYRYDFSDGNSIVVKVYYTRIFDYKACSKNYEDRFSDGWGKEEYYLLKPGRHFKDCETNRSSLVEYLKDFQKKGA